jgi:hypothetical protein
VTLNSGMMAVYVLSTDPSRDLCFDVYRLEQQF